MPKAHISDSLRRKIRRRAKNRCEYCQVSERAQVAAFACDHCIPEIRGGPTNLSNLAWACPRCNGSKGAAVDATDPATGEMVPIFDPRKDRWSTHFRWSKNCLKIDGLTPIGRATEKRLKMNRRKMTAVRGFMMRIGLHPPR